jgi:hypothetical protein
MPCQYQDRNKIITDLKIFKKIKSHCGVFLVQKWMKEYIWKWLNITELIGKIENHLI